MLDNTTELIARLMRERDEARAEVERLRARFVELRDEMVKRSKAWDESMQPMCGDFPREDVDIAQAHGALLEAEFVVERLRAELSSARPASTLRSKRRHEAEDAWTATSYYRRAAFWRALHKSLTERYAERGGESPAQMVALREQWRDALEAERAVKEALRTKGRPSAARWIALPTSTQSLVLRRIRHISIDVRRGVEREAAAIAGKILEATLKEEVEQ